MPPASSLSLIIIMTTNKKPSRLDGHGGSLSCDMASFTPQKYISTFVQIIIMFRSGSESIIIKLARDVTVMIHDGINLVSVPWRINKQQDCMNSWDNN